MYNCYSSRPRLYTVLAKKNNSTLYYSASTSRTAYGFLHVLTYINEKPRYKPDTEKYVFWKITYITPRKDTRTSRYRDKAYKYLNCDFLPSFWIPVSFLVTKLCHDSFTAANAVLSILSLQHCFVSFIVCRHKCMMPPF